MIRLLFACCLAGCVGEAAVTYQGSVLAGDADGFGFATERATGTPLAGATVQLCVDARCQGPAEVAADGSFGMLEQVFGGFIGSDTSIEVRAAAPGRNTVIYQAVYESTNDPTNGQAFLNFTLGR